jgi:hypothetical protein
VRVQHEQGADQRADQHRGDRDQPAGHLGAGRGRQWAVGGDAGDGQRQHGGGQVRDAEPACGRVLQAHGGGQRRDQGVAHSPRQRCRDQGRHRHRLGHDHRLDPRGDAEQQLAAGGQEPAQTACDQGAEDKAADRGERRGHGEPSRAGQGEREEDHVTGLVGHEDVPEQQVAERVHQPGDHGQRDQQGRQQAVPAVPRRRDRVPDVGHELAHPRVTAHST